MTSDRQEITRQTYLLELGYRRIVFRLFYVVVGFCLVFLLVVFRLNILKLATEEWYMVATKLIVAASVPLTVLVRSLFFFAPRLYSRYQADSAKLMIRLGRGTREIYYDQIDRLYFSRLSPRFFGGFRARLKSGGWLRFPSLMTNNGQLLELIRRARPDLASQTEYENFLHTANLVEISWQRIRDKMKNWKHWSLKFILYPGFIAFLFHHRGYSIGVHRTAGQNILFWFGIIAAGHLLIAMILNHFEEKLNNRRLFDMDRPKRDLQFEKKLSTGAHIIFYLMTAILAGFTLYGR